MNAPDDFARHIEVGRHFLAVSHYERAAREFEAALGIEASESLVWLLLARCYLHLGWEEGARHATQNALQIEPNNDEAHYLAAFASPTHRGEVEAIDTALALAPHEPAYHGYRAHLWAREGHYEIALQSARRALELAPDSAAAHRQIAGVLFYEAEQKRTLSRAKRQEAAWHIARALEIEPDAAPSHSALGRLNDFYGTAQTSAQAWQEVLRLDPNDRRAQKALHSARRAARMDRPLDWIYRRVFAPLSWPLRLPLLWIFVAGAVKWASVVWQAQPTGIAPYLALGLLIFGGLLSPILWHEWQTWFEGWWASAREKRKIPPR